MADQKQAPPGPKFRRNRPLTSCTECHRRRQKCNQARDRPCNQCARRYPPVICTYERQNGTSSVATAMVPEHSSIKEGPKSTAEPNVLIDALNETFPHKNDHSVLSHLPLGQPGGCIFPLPLAYRSPPPSPKGNRSNTDARTSEVESKAGSRTMSVRTTRLPNDDQAISSLYLLQRIWKSVRRGPATIVGSGTALDNLQSLPIEPTKRNAELFFFFHQSLAPYLASIDGKDPPQDFHEKYMSGIVQCPPAAYLALLAASCYQAAAQGFEVEKFSETIAIEARVMSGIVHHLKENPKSISDEVIRSVVYLTENTWYWGADEQRVWTHMKGLKEMLKLRGGMRHIILEKGLRQEIITNDYQMACCTEADLFLLSDLSDSDHLPQLVPTLANFDNPFYAPAIGGLDTADYLDINSATAQILKDMKFLTTSILSIQAPDPTSTSIAKFQATALWTQKRIAALPSKPGIPTNPTNDLIYETIRLTAILYCNAITSRLPLSKTNQEATFQSLWNTMWLVSVSRWKKTPGMFLWVLLVACPCANERVQRRFLKMNIRMVSLYIELQSWEVAVGCLGAFLRVQKWIGARDKV